MNAVFWIALLGLGLPLYAYVGYPIALFALASLVQIGRDAYYLVSRAERRSQDIWWPSVSIIIAAYNEEEVIGRTLSRCLELDYPEERLEVVVGSDGSTDGTVEIAQQHEGERVQVVAFPERRGKLSVISDCVARAGGDVLVFTDANTVLSRDSVRRLARHFNDPRVGAVCGELRLLTADGPLADEGLYWRYEMVLKILESRLDSVLGANGAIYAVRKDLFPKLAGNLITEDFVIPMKVRASGFRVLYDPEAVAVEDAPATVSDEFRRRIRIGAGNWQALWRCAELLLPWKGFVSFAFWSHKVLRWLAPFLLVAGFLANLALLAEPVWQAVFAAQVGFYGCAVLGYVLRRLRLPAGPLRPASYFVAINAALAVGLVRGVLRMQQPTWQRTAREPVVTRGKQ